jgi:hypothetical protein
MLKTTRLMEDRTIWLRLGVSITASKEKIEKILQGEKEPLYEILDAGEYEICGNSYIPDSEVEEYNDDNDTDFEVRDIEYEM